MISCAGRVEILLLAVCCFCHLKSHVGLPVDEGLVKVATPSETNLKCGDDGWQLFAYHGLCYKLVEKEKAVKREDAQVECETDGAYLAKVLNRPQNFNIRDMLFKKFGGGDKTLKYFFGLCYKGYCYNARLCRTHANGYWSYPPSDSNVNYFYWDISENQPYDFNYECCAAYSYDDNNWAWHSFACDSDVVKGFICEKSAVEPTTTTQEISTDTRTTETPAPISSTTTDSSSPISSTRTDSETPSISPTTTTTKPTARETTNIESTSLSTVPQAAGLGIEYILLISILVLVVIAAIIGLAIYWRLRKQSKETSSSTESSPQYDYTSSYYEGTASSDEKVEKKDKDDEEDNNDNEDSQKEIAVSASHLKLNDDNLESMNGNKRNYF